MTKEEQAKLKDTSMHLLAQVSTCTLYLLDKYQRYHNCSPLTTFSSLPSQKKQFMFLVKKIILIQYNCTCTVAALFYLMFQIHIKLIPSLESQYTSDGFLSLRGFVLLLCVHVHSLNWKVLEHAFFV